MHIIFTLLFISIGIFIAFFSKNIRIVLRAIIILFLLESNSKERPSQNSNKKSKIQ